MIHLKDPSEIETMRKGGEILSGALKVTLDHIKPGVKLKELDRIAEETIKKRDASSSFRMVKGYKWSICSCVNEVVVHGIPNDYILSPGDVVGIDCGVYYQGFHTDAAWTVKVRNGKVGHQDDTDKFLAIGKKALSAAINQVKPGNYIYNISAAIQDTIEKARYSVVRSLVGHGVGRQLHELPEIPCFTRNEREKTTKIVPGMTLAIEVIYNMGSPEVMYRGDDEWTIVTKDGKIAGLFEATVAATFHGYLILAPLNWV